MEVNIRYSFFDDIFTRTNGYIIDNTNKVIQASISLDKWRTVFKAFPSGIKRWMMDSVLSSANLFIPQNRKEFIFSLNNVNRSIKLAFSRNQKGFATLGFLKKMSTGFMQ